MRSIYIHIHTYIYICIYIQTYIHVGMPFSSADPQHGGVPFGFREKRRVPSPKTKDTPIFPDDFSGLTNWATQLFRCLRHIELEAHTLHFTPRLSGGRQVGKRDASNPVIRPGNPKSKSNLMFKVLLSSKTESVRLQHLEKC